MRSDDGNRNQKAKQIKCESNDYKREWYLIAKVSEFFFYALSVAGYYLPKLFFVVPYFALRDALDCPPRGPSTADHVLVGNREEVSLLQRQVVS